MPQKAHIYAWTIIAVGVFIAACAGISWRPDDPAATLVCLVLAMLASTFKIKLPGLTGTISPSFVFVLGPAIFLGDGIHRRGSGVGPVTVAAKSSAQPITGWF